MSSRPSAPSTPRSIAASISSTPHRRTASDHSEEIVGKALAQDQRRERALIATKVGLDWRDGNVFRNASAGRVRQEIEDSLKRLRTDRIDLYQVHWPDPRVPVEQTAAALGALLEEGKIRAIGVSNFSRRSDDRCFNALRRSTRCSRLYNLFRARHRTRRAPVR